MTHKSAEHSHHLPMFVLDVLRHDDVENLDSMLTMLNDSSCIGWREFWPRSFTQEDVIPCIIQHIEDGNIDPCKEDPNGNAIVPADMKNLERRIRHGVLWFHLTRRGQHCWEQWQPPESHDT